jgi:iron complex outermembrane recepter protein
MKVSRSVLLWLVPHILVALPEPVPAQTQLPEIVVRAPRPRLRARQPQHEPKPVQWQATIPPADGVLLNGEPAPIERIPQAIAVIPRSAIDDQTPLTQSEALRNVAATVGVPGNFLYGVNYRVRGFDAERYIDGLPNYLDAGDYTSLVNAERIEVVKGPGALLFQSGGGITGGVINAISKLPVANPSYQAGLIAGGYGLWNPWIDVNQPLGNGALFRFTGDFKKAGDYVDVIERRSYSLNPTFTFTDNDGTSLTIQGRISRRDQQFYVGLPVTGTIDRSLFTLRPDLFVGLPDVPRSLSENSGVTVRLDHALAASGRSMSPLATTRCDS